MEKRKNILNPVLMFVTGLGLVFFYPIVGYVYAKFRQHLFTNGNMDTYGCTDFYI